MSIEEAIRQSFSQAKAHSVLGFKAEANNLLSPFNEKDKKKGPKYVLNVDHKDNSVINIFEDFGNGYAIAATSNVKAANSYLALKSLSNKVFGIDEAKEPEFGENRQSAGYILEIATKLKSKVVYVITPSDADYNYGVKGRDSSLPQHVIFFPEEVNLKLKDLPAVSVKTTIINGQFQLVTLLVDPTDYVQRVPATDALLGHKFFAYNAALYNKVQWLAEKASRTIPIKVSDTINLAEDGLLNFNTIYEIDQSSYTLDVVNASLQRAKEAKGYSFVIVRLQDPNELDLSKQRQFVYITQKERLAGVGIVGMDGIQSIVYKTIDGDEFAGYGYLTSSEEDMYNFFKGLVYGK